MMHVECRGHSGQEPQLCVAAADAPLRGNLSTTAAADCTLCLVAVQLKKKKITKNTLQSLRTEFKCIFEPREETKRQYRIIKMPW